MGKAKRPKKDSSPARSRVKTAAEKKSYANLSGDGDSDTTQQPKPGTSKGKAPKSKAAPKPAKKVPAKKPRGRPVSVKRKLADKSDSEPETEVPQELEEEEVQSSSDSDAPQRPKRTYNRASNKLTKDQEEDMVIWLSDHTEIYNKMSDDFWEGKTQLWTEKADDLNEKAKKAAEDAGLQAPKVQLTEKILQTWFRSMRTQYGKLLKKNFSGEGKKRIGVRAKWLLEKFKFMKNHIQPAYSRRKQETLTPVSIAFFILFSLVKMSKMVENVL